ncbi:succinylglutamate desuccinylase/aspartoacylase family protein [Variovorax sp. PCZ-1]|uniref:succinylglutamate desuccinylase/aspartoacylase domain-containing protein n=1 Tax=Variovorax sp. PCZ-1 TaxID=2835533 RepID=UPI001BCD33D6|nr:succinylglutamate desuccinylase/aspartoacylase family protein [Variovorax sp. PCZ-1]MBS7808670.1 succinylglutamate desuccinylase/aspartoacylase family protein [Variovorax sp. PCZ-1]
MQAHFKPHAVEVERPDISRWEVSNVGAAPYVHEFKSQEIGADVLITSLVHGNEYTGAIVLSELLALLSSCKLVLHRGSLTAVFANVDGFARFDPTQPDASRFVDQDLNRVWSPALLAGSAQSSELARARAIRPYVERATHLLDLHSMHEPCEPLLITGLLPRNVAFAQSLGGVGQVVMDAGHKDGVRMRDFAGFGSEGGSKIALLLEAGQHWQRASVAAVQNVVIRFLLRAEIVTMQEVIDAGLQAWLAADRKPPAPVQVTHAVVARSMQFEFTQAFTGNEIIAKAGTVIAHDADQAITTPYDNCMLVMPSIRQLRPGVTTVRLGRRVAM